MQPLMYLSYESSLTSSSSCYAKEPNRQLLILINFPTELKKKITKKDHFNVNLSKQDGGDSRDLLKKFTLFSGDVGLCKQGIMGRISLFSHS